MRRPRPRLRLLHCSDFHLDIHYREPALDVMRKLVSMQRTLNADIIIMAGDIFDSTRQPAEFVDDMTELFRTLDAPIIAIPGNHDVVYDHRDPTSELFSHLNGQGVYLSSTEGRAVETADRRLRIWGRGMPEHSPSNDPLANLEPMPLDALWNVVLAHGEILSPSSKAAVSSPTVLEHHDLALSRIDYVALGHVHYPFQTSYGRTVIRYSGAASPVIGTGTVTLVEFSSDNGLSITSYPVQG